MNITYFIGNGFDINLGLKTSYSDFLTWYLGRPSGHPIIARFKTLIEKDIETWSDLELTLGKKTIEKPLDSPDAFLMCKTDLDLHLQEYLKEQNDFFPCPPFSEYVSQFRKSLVDFSKFCDSKTRRKLQSIYKHHIKEDHTINIIDFNFTDTVDTLWNKTPDIIGKIIHKQSPKAEDTIFDHLKREAAAFETYYYKGELIHIHGTLDNTMMTGVNDADQLSNSNFKENEDILECCVKPLMNDNCGNDLNERVVEIINNTDIFIVFGMSIGETDKVWWDRIVHQIISNRYSHLLLVNYDPNYTQLLSYTGRYASKSMAANLIRVTHLSSTEQQVLNSQMSVLFNTDMFKLREREPYISFRAVKGSISNWFRKNSYTITMSVISLAFIILIIIWLTFWYQTYLTIYPDTRIGAVPLPQF